jgi:hypothetical protein
MLQYATAIRTFRTSTIGMGMTLKGEHFQSCRMLNVI